MGSGIQGGHAPLNLFRTVVPDARLGCHFVGMMYEASAASMHHANVMVLMYTSISIDVPMQCYDILNGVALVLHDDIIIT